MGLFRVASGVVSVLSELVAREYRTLQLPHWPDGEQPLIEEDGLLSFPTWRDETGALRCAVGTIYEDMHGRDAYGRELPDSFRGGFDDEESSVSSGSATSEAGVDPGTGGPTPGRAHTLGVGQPPTVATQIAAANRITRVGGLRRLRSTRVLEKCRAAARPEVEKPPPESTGEGHDNRR